ncbi:LacI family DNA-binding transcriptional regulator [Bifidobacterium sp. SMB2]|uniref:LacI family DNA-binding transcriptional regulator n=2 Tax=Bifidobacterium saimiriisciurei TaxID=2661627 RepID=A0ABX0CDG6_9BIFI|nr:LacI family DNA-binding transcriptional regulator [Bifidobacterium sp. SMB2]NEG96719.1 LacI family DNA-binding transcriptional regulator [Bifidobacterium sp. SMB2]NEH11875.1 LacI family DNA-binding transcriptional regulator [Bifidobacterium saimiriisciurei]
MARTTISNVAEEAGVSVSTVSRALRGLDKVNPDTRKRVEAAAERLNFSFSKSASSLASGKTMKVAVLLPNEISSWFNSHAFEGIYEVLSKQGYDVIPNVMWEQRDLDRFFKALPNNQNVDAVIVVSFDLDDDKKRILSELTVPVIGLNNPSDEGFDASARIDDFAAMRSAVRLLHSLGHRNLAYIEQPVTSPFTCSAEARVNGFRAAVREVGYRDEDVLVIPSVKRSGVPGGQEEYSGIAAQLLSAPVRPTGICVEHDGCAAALVKELRRLGWDIPGEVSVIGFDDSDIADITGLTTIHQDPVETGRQAAMRALSLMRGECPETPYGVMPTSMVLRDTTGPAAESEA